ncbi:Uncharacterized conserved protein YbbC, DUF1343 family [Jatrophihabitans endophyticus]|uniref:Uncharacterized conserved protein YbbC, DUF1343 family n=1 Tax=Jatrophihabitans endophyticus TaxID=1206085 RepID=A0A1M5SQ69_9ACTN|nr:DUF1343 domain-containing protein [Jatrophihabitans endophyticus]SHH40662.1 Uncharacterized conserved protein YbbC, DUF1343 family [Jatrophihabitans endophyticus]
MTGPSRRRVLGAGALGVAAAAVTGCVGDAATTPAAASSPHPSTHSTHPAHPGHGAGAMRVRTGLARLVDSGYRVLRGRKVGVLTNPTGVTDDLDSIVDVMHADDRVDLRAVFGPEHGFRGTAQAGGSEGSSVDPRTGLTVYDLYNLAWTEMAPLFDEAGVDTIVFDIQDLGVRFYTYMWTLYDVMTACAASGRRVVVLDRPNPQGGNRVAGFRLLPRLETLVGRAPIVQQHGMTAGELARLLAAEYLPDRAGKRLDLTVVPMTGWRRDRPGDTGGLRWVAPSPNIPTVTSALVYVGTCWFEGTNLSQGRGTTQPFELIGAPYVDERWTAALRAAGLPGADFREAAFAPTSAAYQGEVCRGVQTYVTDPVAFDAVRTAVTMLTSLHHLYRDFAWRYDEGDKVEPYDIDKLAGSPALRQGVDAGHSPARIVRTMRADVAGFRSQRRPYLIYREGDSR